MGHSLGLGQGSPSDSVAKGRQVRGRSWAYSGAFPTGIPGAVLSWKSSEGTKLIEERRGFSRDGVFVSRAEGRAETGQG